ncbi:hypothetical protein BKA82DRAFT_4065396, partial [Pisolithus tinctorius]
MGWEGVSVPLTTDMPLMLSMLLLAHHTITSPIMLSSGHVDPSCCVALFGHWGYIYWCCLRHGDHLSFFSFSLSVHHLVSAYTL